MSYASGADPGERQVRLPRGAPVKNRAPASRQITAEQILRESRALQEASAKTPAATIADAEELAEYRLAKRKTFEDDVRRVGRWNPNVWYTYAGWEESQGDLRRARSVWERALEIFSREPSFWLKYAEMEMRHRCANAARNVWDRATSILPRVDQLWYKYAHMEQVLGDVPRARAVFERWVAWEPDGNAWRSYARLEARHGEWARARKVFERYVAVEPSAEAYASYAKFEEAPLAFARGGAGAGRPAAGGPGAAAVDPRPVRLARARRVFERATTALEGGDDAELAGLLAAFADLEERAKEHRRAAAILLLAARVAERLVRASGGDPDAIDEDRIREEEEEEEEGGAGQAGGRGRGDAARSGIFAASSLVASTLFDADRPPRSPEALLLLLRRRLGEVERAHGTGRGADAAAEAEARSRLEARARDPSRAGCDVWFELARLEEGAARAACERAAELRGAAGGTEAAAEARRAVARCRDVYERAVADSLAFARAVTGGGEGSAGRRGDEEAEEDGLGDAVAARPPAASPDLPPHALKAPFRRSVFLWIRYACWEELAAKDRGRARAVLALARRALPRGPALFASLWILAAQLEVRDLRLDAARALLLAAVRQAPLKAKLHRARQELEAALGCAAECRAAHEDEVRCLPASASAWVRLAKLEDALGEDERARAVYEAALARDLLDAPELVWKAYLDFELARGGRAAARALYERLASRANHPRVWASWATMEATPMKELMKAAREEEEEEEGREEGEGAPEELDEAGRPVGEEGADEASRRAAREAHARRVYERGFESLRRELPDEKEAAASLLSTWREFEAGCAAEPPARRAERLRDLDARAPRQVRRRREELDERTGEPTGRMVEDFELVFPDDAAAAPDLKLLAAAYEWKRRKLAQQAE